ncbi:arylsulfotransferase (ASST) domain protein [Metarhizium robertsii]|uniref:Arylsulfotransferase n=2 Tax=Metarhizium robertsii TaxID=568076 RepID=E9F2D0_METRA|nr:arylsulfotransferase [Metarhizium robertsii ARSEF 23]EFY98219.1 arylsulfotransferase [Metarhizium robertsii ARSEF 23]EXV01599.1 arylsulfotransferase (ASST) domain protein [Metarhizium robertsii]
MKATCSSLLGLVTAALLAPVAADWQFRSRPDLAPPRLNITIPATNAVEKGYLFLAPFAGFPDTPTEQHGPRQAGPYIFRDNGDLVWSGYSIFSIWSTNFQAGRWKGKDVLFSFEGDHNAGYGHGHGHITFVDQRYETIRELRAGNHKLVDKHEFHIVNEETGLIQIYQPVPRDLTKWGASPEQQWIVNAIIQELDISTGKLLFEWSSLDHVTPDEAILPINPGQAGSGYNSSDAWDYFHINSVDKDAEGNYLISARDACAVHKINGTDGSIIWRLNGNRSDFKMAKGTKFCFQHHARWLSQEDGIEIISLYDNSAHGTEHSGGSEVHTAPTSSGKILKLNTKSWTADLVRAYFPPDHLLSKSQGSTQVLPGGNVLVGWGSEGAVTEFTSDGTPIFHAYMDSGLLGDGVQNYRAFRYNWTGLPSEDPAIVALESNDGTAVYVSWNGDTETAVWRFYAETDEFASRHFLGEVERKSFETKLLVPNQKLTSVSAEAIDASGKLLISTAVVKTEQEILPPRTKATPHKVKLVEEVEEQKAFKKGGLWKEYGLLKFVRLRIPLGDDL